MIPAESVEVTPSSLELFVGQTGRLSAKVLPIDSTDAISWSSDHPEIADVDSSGVVTAKSEGSAVITGVAGDFSGECSVVVGVEQVTLTVVPSPEDSQVKLNGEVRTEITVDKGSEVTYEVSKAGYVTKSGSFEVDSTKTETVTLDPEVETEFELTSDAPDSLQKATETTVNVTISVKTPGNVGYSKVQFQFDSTRPSGGNITFKAKDSLEQESTFVNSGVWGPPEGFAIGPDYTATTPFTISADTAGEYTVTYKLVNLEDSSTICESTETIQITE